MGRKTAKRYGRGRYDGCVHYRDRELSDEENATLFGVAVAAGIAGAMALDLAMRLMGV